MAKEPEIFAPTPAGPKFLKCKKGDRVRLLVAHYDGYQRVEAGTVVNWWSDEPPTIENAALAADSKPTPLDAPAFTDGKPPPGYLDPVSGEEAVVHGPTLAA